MGFLRRLFTSTEVPDGDPAPIPTAEEVDVAERAHERELFAAEQARLDDLQDRQLRFERYSWRPAPEGGERRADDSDAQGSAGVPGEGP